MSDIESGSAHVDGLGAGIQGEPGPASRGQGVRAVVISDGKGRLAETLAALAAQSYGNLGVTVVDACGSDPGSVSEPDIDEVATRFHSAVIAAPRGVQFAEAANVMLADTSLDAEWILFLHDEVALDPGAVDALVDGALQVNADIAAPKICDWSQPEVLREVGMGADRFGYPFTTVEPGEVDHGQHDKDRTALYVTTTAMLVRTGLFRQLGGFDPALGSIEQDLDFCWRARLAGASVAVISAAVAYHEPGELDRGQVEAPRIRAQRNRLRVMLKCYAITKLPVVLFQLAMLNLLEIVLLAGSGRSRRARAIFGAWGSALLNAGPIWSARRMTQRQRRIPDSGIRALMMPDSARVRAYIDNRLREEAGEEDSLAQKSSGTGVWEFALHEITKPQVLFWAVAIVAIAIGARRFAFDTAVPFVGQAVPVPSSGELWRAYASPWQSFGFGTPAPSAPAGPVLGLVQWVFPAWGTAKVLVGFYVLGVLGAWRTSSRIGRWPGPGVAAVLYGLSPVLLGAMQRGNVAGIAFFGLAPFILGCIVSHFTERRGAVGAIRRVFGLALLLAIAGAFFPPALPIAVAISLVLVVGSLFASRLLAALASFVTTTIASVLAFGLLWPWSYSLVRPGSPLVEAWTGWEGAKFQIGSAGVLRMDLVSAGSRPWGYLLPGLALLALLVVKGERLGWALRLWMVALASLAPIWLAGQGIVDQALPIAFGVMVPAALALSLVAGAGASELASESAGEKKPLRKMAIVIVAIASVLLLAPHLWALMNGRLGLGDNDYRRAIQAASEAGRGESFKILWIGSQPDLPGYPLPLPGTEGAGAYSLSGPDGPVFGDTSPQTPGSGSAHLAQVMSGIASEGSTRGGRSLATLGVRYVVIPHSSLVPTSGAAGTLPPPRELVEGLRRQLDIKEMQAAPGVTVFEVAAGSRLGDSALVGPSIMEAARGGPDAEDTDEKLLSAEFADARPVFDKPVPGEIGYIDADEGMGLILAEQYDDRWALVDGTGVTALPTTHETAFDWSNGFVFGSDVSAPARLEFRDDGHRSRELAIQGAALVSLLLLFRLFRERAYDEGASRPDRPAAVA